MSAPTNAAGGPPRDGPLTVLIADDHPLFRQGLKEVLRGDPRFDVVAEAADGETALEEIRRLGPALAVLDVEMPKLSGLLVTEAVRREGLAVAVVVLTMHRDGRMLDRALASGARGFVLKDSAVTEIVACLHMVAEGRAYVSPALSQDLIGRRARLTPVEEMLARLTPAERRVIRLVAANRTSQEIADDLGIALKTVENHRSHICRKLDLEGPHALLRFALEHRAALEKPPASPA